MQVIKEMVDSSEKVVSNKIKLSCIGPLFQILWESGLLILVLQGTSSDRRMLSRIW